MIERKFGKKRMLQNTAIIAAVWIFLISISVFDPVWFNNSRMQLPATLYIWLCWPGYLLTIYLEWKKSIATNLRGNGEISPK